MKSIYASPFRVYLALAACALAGILCGTQLPVSLFPNSSKPKITVRMPYGNFTPLEFHQAYGRDLESQLHKIVADGYEVDKLQVEYTPERVNYEVEFKWGAPPRTSFKEVRLVVNSFAGRLPDEIRDAVNIWPDNDNSGFIAVSFFSPTRALDEIWELLDPLLMPEVARVEDTSDPELWNPSRKEIRVELVPDKMAALQLFPRDIERAIVGSLQTAAGGSMTVGTAQLGIQLAKPTQTLADLSRAIVPAHGPGTVAVHLSDVARIDYGLRTTDSKSFKTDGAPSILLFATPRSGGNIKRMSEEILDIIKLKSAQFPPDLQYRVLVDPSEFIRSAIHNVFREVGIGALLAVAVLFLFIGSLRNTITAAIEIPLSMVLAFLLMKLSGMNLNLISLGGLALSAGMNVDASVVVMENIFRHFEEKAAGQALSFAEKLDIIAGAVAEVRFAVIASTAASLVVFLPLAFTSELSYAILGDLAKTVVFSHGFSAFVALILVPTVRLHLMSHGGARSVEKPVHSPIEGAIRRLENGYARALSYFIRSPRLKLATYGGLVAVLVALTIAVMPRLPREIIGTPDTDWMIVSVNTKGNTLMRQMESQAEEIEAQVLDKFGTKILYTFTQVRGANRASVMARLKNKADMREIWPAMEKAFVNTPFLFYWVGPWNPSELPIPDPPARTA